MVLPYNVNCRLTILVDGSWRIKDLDTKVLYDGLDTLDHFGGYAEVAELGVR